MVVACVRPSVCPPVSLRLSVQLFDKYFSCFFNWLEYFWVNISDKFEDGYRSSLNMRIFNQTVTLNYFLFSDFTFDTTGPFTWLLDLSDGFYGMPIFVFLTNFKIFVLMNIRACNDRVHINWWSFVPIFWNLTNTLLRWRRPFFWAWSIGKMVSGWGLGDLKWFGNRPN